MRKRFVVFGMVDDEDNQPLFWNNNEGWTILRDADIFSEKQVDSLNLPIGGTWVELPQYFKKKE